MNFQHSAFLSSQDLPGVYPIPSYSALPSLKTFVLPNDTVPIHELHDAPVKKIKSNFHNPIPISPYMYCQAIQPICYTPNSVSTNHVVKPAQRQKKLVVKGHSYNLQGFTNKSCNNIRVLTGKRKNPDTEDENLQQDSIQEDIVKTPPDQKLVQSDLSEITIPENQAKCEPYSYQQETKSYLKNPIHINQQTLNIKQFLAKPTYMLNQPLQSSLHTPKLHSKVLIQKPLSRTAQMYIQQNLELHQINILKDITTQKLLRSNVTRPIMFSNF